MALTMMFSQGSIKSYSNCPICDGSAHAVAEMPNYPVTEVYKPFGSVNYRGPKCADQQLLCCPDCQHLFLGRHLPRDFIYTHYVTESSSSHGAQKALKNFYNFVVSRSSAQVAGIIDIGANDTSLLELFGGSGAKLVGIDPNISSSNPDVHCIKSYVEDCDLADLVHGRRIFLCSHTLEHIYEPRLFLSQIAAVLEAEDDLFLQFPSFELLVRDCRFDQIHHQHLNYFSFVSLKKLLGEFGLTITAHRYDDDHYGALMCQVRKGGDVSVPTIQRVNIDVVRASHQAFISSINAAEARIALLGGQFYCFGASLMLPILAYYLPSLAKAHAIIDMSLIKQGLTYVNFELPIIGEAEVDYLSTDFVVTAVATKAATRQIVKSLLERESRNIICPLNTL
jgi:hypothetical protein